jgi:hypothetical protein
VHLREATFWLFGRACLRCRTERPLEVAHVVDWPRCRELDSSPVGGIKPPTWFVDGEAIRLFHNIANVLPLCGNCHGLYDGRHHEDVVLKLLTLSGSPRRA